jgi:endonuclease G, mitochondrial
VKATLIVVGLLWASVTLNADYLEIRRAVTLKSSPAGNAQVVAQLQPSGYVELIDGNQRNGYYRARVPSTGEEGWVYRTFVRRHRGEIPEEAEEDSEGGTVNSSRTTSAHCLISCPIGTSASNLLITRDIYALSNNGTTKFADWVAYRVSTDTIGPTKPRNWKRDPLLPADATLEPEDYASANEQLGTDRGHQAPLASFTGTGNWPATNFLSNITPQQAELNQGTWERLESAERRLAREGITVFTLTGPLYERDMPPLPEADEPHRVPSGYWKIVATQEDEGIDMAAFVMDQATPRGDNFCSKVTTVDDIEKRTGLNFFSGLSTASENRLESSPGALAIRLGCAP